MLVTAEVQWLADRSRCLLRYISHAVCVQRAENNMTFEPAVQRPHQGDVPVVLYPFDGPFSYSGTPFTNVLMAVGNWTFSRTRSVHRTRFLWHATFREVMCLSL